MVLEELLFECKKNNPKAQKQLYQLFEKKLFGMCLKYSKSLEDAQDNLQEGFIVLFQKINQYTGKGSFEGWAKRIMINIALQKHKEVRFMDIIEENYPEVEVLLDEENELPLEYLMQIIQDLPDQYRIVFNLYVLDGYSHKEISDMMGISVGTTKSNLHRARLHLKNTIEKREVKTNEKVAK